MWDLLASLLEVFGIAPPGRVTVKDRYEMKKKVRALRLRERAEKQAAEAASRTK